MVGLTRLFSVLQTPGNASHGSLGQVAQVSATLGVPGPAQGAVFGRRQLIGGRRAAGDDRHDGLSFRSTAARRRRDQRQQQQHQWRQSRGRTTVYNYATAAAATTVVIIII